MIFVYGESRTTSKACQTLARRREIESELILMLAAVKKNTEGVLDSREIELNSLNYKNVFNLVEDHGQDSVSCKWVVTEKQKVNGSNMLKAR